MRWGQEGKSSQKKRQKKKEKKKEEKKNTVQERSTQKCDKGLTFYIEVNLML